MMFNNSIFLWLTGATLIVASVFSFLFTQVEISLALNAHHTTFLDYFSYFVTYLGDGFFSLGVGFILLFVNRKAGVFVLLSYTISSGLTQLLKHFVFNQMRRPLWHLEQMVNVMYYRPPGAELVYNNSFPSGHTTSAFALFCLVSLLVQNNFYKLVFFFLALSVAFTRIYLLQHFLVDTMAGAFIGTLCSYLVYLLLYQKDKLKILY